MGKKKGKLLIVDDHKTVLKALTQLLEPEFEMVKAVNSPNLIPGLIKSEAFDIFLLDMNFSAGLHTGNEGIFWMREILKNDPLASVVLITAYGDIETAVRAVKEGATDFILKPWDNDKLIVTLNAALKLRESNSQIDKLKNKQQHLSENIGHQFNTIIGSSDSMKAVFNTIDKVAKTEANVLILGENGTGKELVAHEIHRQSKRSDEVFLSVDMGSISETLFESEMFGHIKGAFTDAKENRPGRFETASGGTLFMDEISNLSTLMQAKLLTAIQNREITRLGSNQAIPVDIRLICATNKNMNELITNHLFREDLLYRINTIEITLPPLRERGDDIVLLANHYLRKYAIKYEKPLLKISHDAVDELMNYHWPGNVRELQHTIEKAVIMCDSEILEPDDIFILKTRTDRKEAAAPSTFAEIEKDAIKRALENNNGSVYNTAKELGLARQTVYNKILKYGLHYS